MPDTLHELDMATVSDLRDISRKAISEEERCNERVAILKLLLIKLGVKETAKEMEHIFHE